MAITIEPVCHWKFRNGLEIEIPVGRYLVRCDSRAEWFKIYALFDELDERYNFRYDTPNHGLMPFCVHQSDKDENVIVIEPFVNGDIQCGDFVLPLRLPDPEVLKAQERLQWLEYG